MIKKQFFIKSVVAAVIFLLTAICSYAQQLDFLKKSFYLKTYGGKEFKSSLFFFSVCQDRNGCMLFATSSGLYIMDCEKFSKCKTRNFSGISRVATGIHDEIFVCGDADFGYFVSSDSSGFKYMSLSDSYNFDSEIISDVMPYKNSIYFFGNKGVYCYDYSKITKISSSGGIKNSGGLNLPCYIDFSGKLNFIKDGHVIEKFDLNTLGLSLSDTKISFVGNKVGVLITDGKKFFTVSFESFTSENALESSDFKEILYDYGFEKNVRKVSIAYDSIFSRTALSVNSKIIILDENLNYLSEVNSLSLGMPKEDIIYLRFDSSFNLWSVSMYHVTKILLTTPVVMYDRNFGIDGTSFSLKKVKDKYFCCGFNGLFVSDVADSLNFKKVEFENFNSRSALVCWDVEEIDGVLIAATSKGIFEIKGLKAQKILALDNIYQCRVSDKYPGKFFIVGYDGFFVGDYYKENSLKFKNLHVVDGLNYPMWKMYVDKNGMIWLASIFWGIYYVVPKDFDSDRYSVVSIGNNFDGFRSLRQLSVYLDNESINICDYGFYSSKLPNKIDFFSNELNFKIDSLLFMNRYEDYEDKLQCIHVENSDYVLIRDFNSYILASKSSSGKRILDTLAIKHDTYTLFSAQLYDSLLFISSEIGLLVYNLNVNRNTLPEKLDFNVLITSVKCNGKDVFSGYKYFEDSKPRVYSPSEGGYVNLGDEVRSVEFEYASTCLEKNEKTTYSYFLEGHDTSWSPFQEECRHNFGQLPAGKYVFNVKAKNYVGLESLVAVYRFSIPSPWYISWWAVLLYVFLIFACIVWFVKQKTKKLKSQNFRLEKQKQVMDKELSEQNHRLQMMSLVASKTTNSVIILDTSGCFVFANHSFEKLYGCSLKEYQQKYGDNYFDSVVNGEVENTFYINQARQSQESQSFEYYHESESLGKKYVQMTIDPIFDNKGQLSNWIIIETDITQLKKSSVEMLEQTKALTTAYMELANQNNEIEVQRMQLLEANDKLEVGYEKIARQNITITESIHYAQSIQNSILPNSEDFSEFLDTFILYMPKDIVSGDFYLYEKLGNGEFITIVADCTGHGVPGAFMSLIGYDILEQIIRMSNITEPIEILETLSEKFTAALRQQDSQHNTDGIDLSICKFSPYNGGYNVTFSGTRSSIYVFFAKENRIEKIRGSQRQIGYGFETTTSDYKFQTHTFFLSDKDFMIMLSDGLIDQCNKDRRRFGSQRFSEFLVLNADCKMREMGNRLGNTIDEFMDMAGQRDDITVLGLKIKQQ